MLDHTESTVPERLLLFKTDVQGSIEALISLTDNLPKHEGMTLPLGRYIVGVLALQSTEPGMLCLVLVSIRLRYSAVSCGQGCCWSYY
jgi:hypothetical protein